MAQGNRAVSQPSDPMGVIGEQPACMVIESWEQAREAKDQLVNIRAGALSGAALLAGLADLVKSAETLDVEATEEEEDPVTEWLIHKLKEIVQGRPGKGKILQGLRNLLKEAGDWEQPEPPRGRPAGAGASSGAARRQSRSNSRSRSRPREITFDEGWQEQTQGGRRPRDKPEKGGNG